MVDDNETIETDEIETEEERQQPEESPTEEPSDLRSTLEAAMRKHEEAAPEDKDAKGDRSRDERGRFATKKISDQAAPIEASEASEPIAPPYSWSAENKELFSQLPRQMQEYLSRREQEREGFLNRKSQEISATREKYAAFDKLIEQHGDTFRRANVDPYTGLESLVLAQQYLDKDPAGALRLMAQSYGLDLSQLAGTAEQSSAPQMYPQMHYVNNELDTIRAKLAAIEHEKVAQQQRAAIGEVEAFANEMDGSGKLVRPYMGDVHEQMMDEVRLIRSRHPDMPARDILQQAYETSCWKNPNVRARLLEAERQPHIQAQRVQQAKLAGSSVRGAPGASTLAANNGSSVRDALLAAMEIHS